MRVIEHVSGSLACLPPQLVHALRWQDGSRSAPLWERLHDVDLPQQLVVALENPLDHLSPIADQVPPIGDVERIRRASLAASRVPLTAVTTNDFNVRPRSQPRRECLGSAIRQQIDDPMGFKIHEERAIAGTLPVWPNRLLPARAAWTASGAARLESR